MVVNEGDRPRGPVASKPWHASLMVNEAPVLCVPDSLCKNALGAEVKQETAACLLQPVHQGLTRLVLVILQTIVTPPAFKLVTFRCLHSMLLHTAVKTPGPDVVKFGTQ